MSNTKETSIAASFFWFGILVLDVASGFVFGPLVAIVAIGVVCVLFGGGYLVLHAIAEKRGG